MPGSPLEITLFGKAIADRLAGLCLLDRCGADAVSSADACFEDIARHVRDRFPDRPLRLIGFSLGASAALRTAAILGPRVERIDIISAAAPLSLGDYLPGMAGAPVFRSALTSPVLLRLLTWLQAKAVVAVPAPLYSALFSSARGEDAALARDPEFRSIMVELLQRCLGAGSTAYRREIELYTQSWDAELDRVIQPVWIHHGREDNWAPVAMASDLAARLPRCAGLRLLDDMSHYSTLRAVLSTV
jgi:pimeloyl-ACP methyl ester carboxylesterase